MRKLSLVLLFGLVGCEIFNGPAKAPQPEDEDADFRGTMDATRVTRGGRTANLVDARTDTHDDYDRVVFVFEDRVPGYQIEYVQNPTECGSGDKVNPIGEYYLQVTFEPARMHTEGAETTVDRDLLAASDNVRQVVATCDFEGDVSWVIGLDSRLPYRVRELTDPPRLLVDVQHDEDRVISQTP